MKPGLMRRVLESFDAAILSVEGDALRVEGHAPDWLRLLLGDRDLSGPLTVPEASAFLNNFMHDARELWAAPATGRVESGAWIEVDEAGTEWAFQATALKDHDGDLLVLRRVPDEHDGARTLLQRARGFLLDNETLERVVAERTSTIRRREEEIALCLVTAAEWRDSDTGDHIRRIGGMAQAVARELGEPRDFVEDMWLAAAMHDIGKIGIPDGILQKPGPLTPAERAVMQEHSVIGKAVLSGSRAPLLQLAAEIAHHHHERVDGGGYPDGLAGDEIPLSARIVAVVDVYDALTTDRVYRKAWPLADVLEYLQAGRDRHFDRQVLDVFLSLRPGL